MVRKRSTDLMFMLGLNETIDQLAMTNSVRWMWQTVFVGYGKQCSLAWSGVEDRGWSRLNKGIIF